MARSSSSSSSEVDEDISANNVKFETDEAKFSLQPYLFEPIRLRKAPVPAATVKAKQMKRVRTLPADESRLDNLEW